MKRKTWIVIAAVSFAVAGLLAVFLGSASLRKKEAEEAYRRLQRQKQTTELQIMEETEQPAVEEEKEKPDIPIDFASLQEQNSDIYAWITIPGTKIDYPVVQNEDNTFYLRRSIEKKKSTGGTIFSEHENSKDFDDYITVLYGHNMHNGTMFADLHLYEDKKFMEEHDEILIYTPEAILKYKIFAAYRTDNRHILYYYQKGMDKDSRMAYIKEIIGQRQMGASIDTEAPVDEESRILTLSTCDRAGKEYRYLVQAYLAERIE